MSSRTLPRTSARARSSAAAALRNRPALRRPRVSCCTASAARGRVREAGRPGVAGQVGAVGVGGGAGFAVRGAFGVDGVWGGRHAWVLEVNPRPPASLELFGAGSFEAHV